MTICIDLTSLSYHLSGIERYAMCMTEKMIDLDQRNKYVLIFRNEVTQVFKNRIDGNRIKAVVLRGNNKLLFFQVTLYRTLKRIKASKYIFFAFPSPLFFKKKGIINTIHDMGAWDSAESMTLLSRYYFRISYRRAAKVSEKIITVSKFSKGRIHEILRIPNTKIEVIYSAIYGNMLNGKEVPFETIKKKYGLPEKYIMTLSTLEPRKNMKTLIEAFNNVAEKVGYDLVLVGRKGWKTDDILEENRVKKRIHFTGFVEDEHISSVYKNALCFVFPSLYEGFGLPPVEALAFGTPVVSSDAASIPEVLMDQALYFHSDSRDELEKILIKLESIVDEMPKGLNDYQREHYSFSKSAAKLLELLEG